MERKPNRLAAEKSPYLLQHAYNPVDWYPWGPEALERARRENKPILLSIGYSACHWCHVMERECFENPTIAELMNRLYVNIKVDREERPDLDHLYQIAAQALTGQGGWPLTVFLTPDQRPFYAGTYFPPEDRYGRPGFPRVLVQLHRVFTEEPDRVEAAAAEMMAVLERVHRTGRGGAVPDPAALERAAQALMADADEAFGGFGGAPKFPSPSSLEFLLRAWKRTGVAAYRDHVLYTLRRMARGGIYDQLGGGFHRYAVDRAWLVPHFEKMLYDNALLPPLYVDAYRISGDPFFARIARDTLNYVLREMTHPEGGFYSTQDADSAGEEGAFFVWYPRDVEALFDPVTARIVCEHFGIDEKGNFEKAATVLHVRAGVRELAARHGMAPDEVEALLERARQRMWEAREKRPKPFRDEKILAGWNGLMISALARAAQGLGDEGYAAAARRAAAFLERHLTNGDRLRRSYKEGPGTVPGFLEDYVFVAQGLIDLYEADFDPRHLRRAQQLMERAVDLFWDGGEGGFFLTPADGETLIYRPKEGWDQSVPSGNGVGAQVMLRLYHFTGEAGWREKAEAVLALFGKSMTDNPAGFGSLLNALDRFHGPVKEIVIAAPSPAADGEAEALIRRIHSLYLPNRAVARTDGAADFPPLVAGKVPAAADGRGPGVAVYVCQDFRCERPVHSWQELEPLLTG